MDDAFQVSKGTWRVVNVEEVRKDEFSSTRKCEFLPLVLILGINRRLVPGKKTTTIDGQIAVGIREGHSAAAGVPFVYNP